MRNFKLKRCLNVILRGVLVGLLTTLITKLDGKGDTSVWEDDQVSAKKITRTVFNDKILEIEELFSKFSKESICSLFSHQKSKK